MAGQSGRKPSEAELRDMTEKLDEALSNVPVVTYAQMARLLNTYRQRVYSLWSLLEKGGGENGN